MAKKVAPEKVTAFLARFGAPTDNAAVNAAVTALLTDAHKYRERLRTAAEGPYKPDAKIVELEGELREAEAEVERLGALVPAAGAVILTGDEAKAWDTFKALGKPEDVKKAMTEELPALRTTASAAERTKQANEVARLLGWNPEATAEVLGKGLVVSLVDGKNAKNEAVKVPHVRPAHDDRAATVPLTEWVKTNAAHLTPALTATGGSSGASGGNGSSQTTTPPAPFPVLSAGGSPAATGDPVADFATRAQAARDARPNPLIPRTAAATT